MAKKLQRKSVGRPGMEGGSVFIGLRLPAALAAAIDAWADKRELARSEAMRKLIEAGLKATR